MYKTRLQVRKIVEEYKRVLKKLGVNVEEAILYGSFAKGKQREDSDIDLIVVAKEFQKMNLRERQEVLGIAAVRVMEPIEARGYTPKEIRMPFKASFLSEIIKYGIVFS